MTRIGTLSAAVAAIYAASTTQVLASSWLTDLLNKVLGTTPPPAAPTTPVHSVPEIDASTGLLAIAAVLAVMAFAWERNRRAKA